MIQTLRGMRDISQENAKKFQHFIEIASSVASMASFGFMQTPILEQTKLFKRSVGDSSDIVNKEMYSFIDKGDNDVCLRPEATASVVRSFIETKSDKAGGIYRYFYYGPMFRYERPQKGRFRQFYQFGCESFGIESPYEDALVVKIIAQIFDRLNIGYRVDINSLGCTECMTSFRDTLSAKLKSINEGFCKDCLLRIETNPMRVFDCKVQSCQELTKDVSCITDNLCTTCENDFSLFKSKLSDLNIDFSINKKLVRGLDYYNKSAFEFVSNDVGSQNAIAGGGRYDYLVETLGGVSTPAVGFAIGIDRILELIQTPNAREGYYVGSMIEEGVDMAVNAGFKKQNTHKTYIQYVAKKLKAHLKLADKVGARYCAIIGEDEFSKKQIWVKDLELGGGEAVDIEHF